MALSVNWNWSMPTVGDPNQVANQNQQNFNQMAQGIAQAIQGSRNRDIQQQVRDQAQSNWQAQFDAQQQQRQQENLFRNRDFYAQQQLRDLQMQQLREEMERKKRQEEWQQKFYDQFFGSDPEWDEMKRLQAELSGGKSGNNNASLIMMGLNPYLK